MTCFKREIFRLYVDKEICSEKDLHSQDTTSNLIEYFHTFSAQCKEHVLKNYLKENSISDFEMS